MLNTSLALVFYAKYFSLTKNTGEIQNGGYVRANKEKSGDQVTKCTHFISIR
jgi:hypothetical protein